MATFLNWVISLQFIVFHFKHSFLNRYLGEEPEVFYGSIKDNLLIAKSDATDEELFNVLDQVYLKFLV